MSITVYCEKCDFVTDFSEIQSVYPTGCPEDSCGGRLMIDGTEIPFQEWLEVCEEDKV